MEVSGQLDGPATLLYPLNRKVDGPPKSWSGCFGEEKDLLALVGIKPQFPGCPAYSLVTILTDIPSP